ncbi:MAG: patatin-like phospholipase family protein [Pseudomonadota bacterium]
MAQTFETKKINLALQGGGAHGAFTWGVLDRLLEEERLEFEGITATSAGAMNAAALKCGLIGRGREGARGRLEWFWDGVAQYSLTSNPMVEWLRAWTPEVASAAFTTPAYLASEFVSRVASPYDFNPMNVNPLRPLIGDLDFGNLHSPQGPKLFICATNVRTGKVRVFKDHEITTDTILASACLPTLFQAVEIDDPATGKTESYWDGGYIGNPALFPLFYDTESPDIAIVHINPLYREDVPTRPDEILNRVNEISFNSSLLRELRAIEFVQRLLANGSLDPEKFKDIHIHSLIDDETMTGLSVATKLIPDRKLLLSLKEAGRKVAETFLQSHWGDLNNRSTVDLRAMFN